MILVVRPERISVPRLHRHPTDVVDEIRLVGKEAKQRGRMVGEPRLWLAPARIRELVDDALDEPQAITDGKELDGLEDLLHIRHGVRVPLRDRRFESSAKKTGEPLHSSARGVALARVAELGGLLAGPKRGKELVTNPRIRGDGVVM
jgi:hypothetical protein